MQDELRPLLQLTWPTGQQIPKLIQSVSQSNLMSPAKMHAAGPTLDLELPSVYCARLGIRPLLQLTWPTGQQIPKLIYVPHNTSLRESGYTRLAAGCRSRHDYHTITLTIIWQIQKNKVYITLSYFHESITS